MINKILCVCLIAASGMLINAQPVAKSLFVGGDVSMYFESYTIDGSDQDAELTQIRIMPMVGYFVTDKVAIGLKAGIGSNVEKSKTPGNEYKNSEFTFNIAPLMRYYLTSGTLGIFAEGSANLGFGKTKYVEDGFSQKGNLQSFQIGISPGIYYYITPKIGLEFSAGWVGYQYISEERNGEKRKTSQFQFDIATTGLSLGATFIL